MDMRYIVIASAALLTACSPSPSTNGATSESGTPAAPPGEAPVSAAAPSADGGERFYGQEAFTIVHQLTGAETGVFTEHVRDWGRTRAELTDSTFSMGPVNQAKKTRMVSVGARNITIDEVAGTTTAIDNPFYDRVVGAMKGKDPLAFGEQMMTSMGGSKTGETATIAGHGCEYWSLMGVKTCVTSWGGTLHTATSIGTLVIDRKATEVRIGDGGPDAAFAYDASKVKAVTIPDL